jgi:hypothetical protein
VWCWRGAFAKLKNSSLKMAAIRSSETLVNHIHGHMASQPINNIYNQRLHLHEYLKSVATTCTEQQASTNFENNNWFEVNYVVIEIKHTEVSGHAKPPQNCLFSSIPARGLEKVHCRWLVTSITLRCRVARTRYNMSVRPCEISIQS